MGWYGFRPYVSVAKRRSQAAAYGKKLAKKEGRELAPIEIEGRKITHSFWGQAWCENLERYSDFENRLPRGRTYVRNGSVIDLQIEKGKIKALVSGSEIYHVTIAIAALPKSAWQKVKHDCSQSIDSLIDLLQARFSQGVMQRLSRQGDGLFPSPKEISMRCSCPDWAGMCKHVAATMYGVGARLDAAPELLFTLRAVDHLELIGQAVAEDNLVRTLDAAQGALAGSDLGELFGIDLESGNKAAKGSVSNKKAEQAKKPRGAKKARADKQPDPPAKPRRGKRAAPEAATEQVEPGPGKAARGKAARGQEGLRGRSFAKKSAASRTTAASHRRSAKAK